MSNKNTESDELTDKEKALVDRVLLRHIGTLRDLGAFNDARSFEEIRAKLLRLGAV